MSAQDFADWVFAIGTAALLLFIFAALLRDWWRD